MNIWYEQYSKKTKTRTHFNVRSRLFDPGDVETAGDEGVGVGHLLDDLAGGLAGAVARLRVHEDEQRVCLLGAAAYNVLQGGDVLEGVQRHHPVVMVPRQQEHCGVLDPVALWDVDVMERGVSGKEEQREGTEFIYQHKCRETSPVSQLGLQITNI